MNNKKNDLDFHAIALLLPEEIRRKLSKKLMPEHERNGQVSIKTAQALAHALRDSIPPESEYSFERKSNIKTPRRTEASSTTPTIFPPNYKIMELRESQFKNLEVEHNGLIPKDQLVIGNIYSYVGSFGNTEYFVIGQFNEDKVDIKAVEAKS